MLLKSPFDNKRTYYIRPCESLKERAASPPVHRFWRILKRPHCVIYDVGVYKRLIALNVDDYVILPGHLGHCLMTPLCACIPWVFSASSKSVRRQWPHANGLVMQSTQHRQREHISSGIDARKLYWQKMSCCKMTMQNPATGDTIAPACLQLSVLGY